MEINVGLADMDAWDAFVASNRDALLAAYPTIAAALKAACDGGIVIGGGAAPQFHVYFSDSAEPLIKAYMAVHFSASGAADALPEFFATRDEADRAAGAAYQTLPWAIRHEIQEVMVEKGSIGECGN